MSDTEDTLDQEQERLRGLLKKQAKRKKVASVFAVAAAAGFFGGVLGSHFVLAVDEASRFSSSSSSQQAGEKRRPSRLNGGELRKEPRPHPSFIKLGNNTADAVADICGSTGERDKDQYYRKAEDYAAWTRGVLYHIGAPAGYGLSSHDEDLHLPVDEAVDLVNAIGGAQDILFVSASLTLNTEAVYVVNKEGQPFLFTQVVITDEPMLADFIHLVLQKRKEINGFATEGLMYRLDRDGNHGMEIIENGSAEGNSVARALSDCRRLDNPSPAIP